MLGLGVGIWKVGGEAREIEGTRDLAKGAKMLLGYDAAVYRWVWERGRVGGVLWKLRETRLVDLDSLVRDVPVCSWGR